jgi:hypothetical protein
MPLHGGTTHDRHGNPFGFYQQNTLGSDTIQKYKDGTITNSAERSIFATPFTWLLQVFLLKNYQQFVTIRYCKKVIKTGNALSNFFFSKSTEQNLN